MSFQTHLARLLDAQLQTFGRQVTYTPAAGDPVTVTGIVANPKTIPEVWPGQYYGLTVRLSDFAARPQKGDTFAFGGETFTVFDVADPDGGKLQLTLSKNRPAPAPVEP